MNRPGLKSPQAASRSEASKGGMGRHAPRPCVHTGVSIVCWSAWRPGPLYEFFELLKLTSWVDLVWTTTTTMGPPLIGRRRHP